MKDTEIIGKIRHFNRFYTRQIGILDEHILDSPFSLTEARVLYELGHHENLTASKLGAELGIDAGHLSRILRNFDRHLLITRTRDRSDARQTFLNLTPEGRRQVQELNDVSDREIRSLLGNLVPDEKTRLVAAMEEVEKILGKRKEADRSFVLRNPQPGDFGWVVQKNGEIYAAEYGWNEEYEGLVAQIVADFIKNFDPKCERCWIAEKDGATVGSVFLVRRDDTTAQLRLLIVDPKARGLGIGRRLVSECTRFARQVGYRKIMLWTNSVLVAARHIYEQEGYRLVSEERNQLFGHSLTSQTWELEL